MDIKLVSVLIVCIFGTSSINGSPPLRRDTNDIDDERPPKSGKPNIVFIVGDDVGFNDVPWNNPNIKSPYLLNLAMEGIRLNQTYLLPSCSPSRAALLTGVYPFRSGMQGQVIQSTYPIGLPLKYRTIANELQDLGYSTHAIGKWNQGFCHMNYTPTFRGFDTFFGFYQPVIHFYTHNVFFNALEVNGRTGYDMHNNTDVTWDYYGQHNSIPFVKQAREVIANHDMSKPFFLYYASPYCHIPHEVPRKFEDMHQDSNMKNFFRRGFYARCSALDEDIKNVVEALKEKGLYNNSIIVFTSDNGASPYSGGSNYPLRGGKTTLYEGGTRIPAMVHSPKYISKGFVYDGLMHGIDWLPTLVSAAGGKASGDIDGMDLWNPIINNKVSPRKLFFYNVVDRGNDFLAAVRKGNWKLIVGKSGVPRNWYKEEDTKGDFVNSYYEYKALELDPTFNDTVQLFNLKDDPTETNDLSDRKPQKVKELMALIDQARKESVKVTPKIDDPAGDPALTGGAFMPGWCKPTVYPV